jgi:methylenetetrahydrofolate reductase (NADPH)
VNNDFHQGHTLFEVLKGLEVQNLDKAPQSQANGVKDQPNGLEVPA